MTPYAIVETGSKQYRVEPNQVIEVERFAPGENPKEVVLDRVLFYKDGEDFQVGQPCLPGAQVVCDYLGDFRQTKVIAFKYRPKKHSKRIRGHRQELTRLRVREIRLAS